MGPAPIKRKGVKGPKKIPTQGKGNRAKKGGGVEHNHGNGDLCMRRKEKKNSNGLHGRVKPRGKGERGKLGRYRSSGKEGKVVGGGGE